ncbi:MAG: alpha/beta hydrolase [Clostridia bacterium]|nr:alpha/beta hydrolase [Clostridia bacterium]MBQ1996401.1 alpha/beta hydrolase [Clostridia bacterium]MBQ5905070.1 alpha/beta hydrolase [Clostridia bacterium]
MKVLNKILGAFWGNTKRQDDKRIATLSWPENIEESRDNPYIDDGNPMHLIDVCYPANAEGKLPVIIDVHGGGWMYGDKELNKNYCHHLAKRGYVVFVMSYRLYPEVTADEQLRDVFASLKWIKEHLDEYNCDKNRILLTGDSAGGMLAGFTALISSSEELRDAYGVEDHGLDFDAVCLTSPMLYMNPDHVSGHYTRIAIGKDFKSKKWGQYVNLDQLLTVGKMPPAILVTSTGDFLARKHTLMGAEELIRHGVETKLLDFPKQENGKELPHVFAILYPEKKPSVDAIEEMLSFFHKHADNKVIK